jgi:hypothetical protein
VRKPDFLLAAFALTFFLGSAGPAQVARAGVRLCASHTLTGSDRSGAWRVIKRTAGKRIIRWKSLSSCVNRDSAQAWIDLEHEPQADGSIIHPALSCERGHLIWECTDTPSRFLGVTVTSGAREHRINVQLPRSLSVAGVKPLVEEGFRRAPLLRPEQECGLGTGDSGDVQMLENPKSAFTLDGTEKTLSLIEYEASEIWLETFTEALVFSRSAAPGSPYVFKCWQVMIVIG